MSHNELETQEENANLFTIAELRERLRKTREYGITQCQSCDEHQATDIHHLDGNHKHNHPSNLSAWCKRCHNEHHGISDNLTQLGLMTRQFYDIQDQRKAMANRLRAYRQLGYNLEEAESILQELKTVEDHLNKKIAKLVKAEPIHQEWLQHVKGIGPLLSASLISIIGDPGRFPTISSLWAYAGLEVRNGEARKRKKGEVANWNATLRTCTWKVGKQFVKQGEFGRVLYDRYKDFYTRRDNGTISNGHIDNRARRKVVKVFLSCLWVKWREIKELPVSKPFAHQHLAEEHTQIITPEEWVS